MEKKILAEQATLFFEKCYNEKPGGIFLSPGRINIIGEHVDYNDGFVLPAAIDKYVCIAITENPNSQCIIVSKDLDERFEFDLDKPLKPVNQMWANYFLGVIQQMIARNLKVKGFKAIFTSTVPIGSGLSSSAAIECAFAYALNEINNLGLDKKELALIGQKAEHTFVGVMCGIMDQFASVFGKKDKVIKHFYC